MATVAWQSLELDQCEACGALWFDAKEFGTYLRSPPEYVSTPASAPEPANPTLRCPHCIHVPLEPREQRGATAHACGECKGVFLLPFDLNLILNGRRGHGADNGVLDVLDVGSDAIGLILEWLAALLLD